MPRPIFTILIWKGQQKAELSGRAAVLLVTLEGLFLISASIFLVLVGTGRRDQADPLNLVLLALLTIILALRAQSHEPSGEKRAAPTSLWSALETLFVWVGGALTLGWAVLALVRR